MENFPALRLILRFGRLWSLLVALLATVLIVFLAWGYFGGWALLAAPFTIPFLYFLAKSYVELIQIVVQMVH